MTPNSPILRRDRAFSPSGSLLDIQISFALTAANGSLLVALAQTMISISLIAFRHAAQACLGSALQLRLGLRSPDPRAE